MNFNFKFLVPGVFLSLAATAVAHAYIPPGQFIIKNMASKRTGTHLIRLVSQVSGYDAGKPNGQRFKAVTVFNVLTHTMTSQALNDQGAELFGVEKKGEALPLAMTLLYDSNTREIVAALKRAEIPVHVEENVPTASASSLPDLFRRRQLRMKLRGFAAGRAQSRGSSGFPQRAKMDRSFGSKKTRFFRFASSLAIRIFNLRSTAIRRTFRIRGRLRLRIGRE